MKSHDDPRGNFSRRSLEGLRTATENSAARRRTLAQKLAESQRPKEPVKLHQESVGICKPALSVQRLPPIRLYHRSDPATEVNLVPAADASVEAIAQAVLRRESQVIITWPDKVKRPLALTVTALLRAQSAVPRLRSTVAYYPFSARSLRGLRSIFLDEDDIATRYHDFIVAMDRSEYGTVDYKYAYLLKGLKTALLKGQKTPRAAESLPTVRSKPALREMVPIFCPRAGRHDQQYDTEDSDFLGDISARRILIKEASAYRKEIASIEAAPIAILGLEQGVEAIKRSFKTAPRLLAGCDLILADATSVPFGGTGAWLKGLRRLNHLAANYDRQPPIVVLTADPFIAKAAFEILNARNEADGSATAELHAFIKIVSNDFSAQAAQQMSWKPVEVSVQLREQRLVSFTDDAISLARDLRVAGYPEAADAVISGLTFVRTIASLPVSFDAMRKHLDVMEGAGAISTRSAAPYRPLNILARLKRASEKVDSSGDRMVFFQAAVSEMVVRYSAGSEITELVRGLVEKATKKANKTIFAFRDRIVLHAFDSWLHDQEYIDHEKVGQKVLLTTSDALGSAVSAAIRGAPIDTLVLVHPKSRHLQRIIMSPALPRKLILIGDAGSLGSFHTLICSVREVLTGDPARRVDAVLKALDACKTQFSGFDFETVIAPEFKREITLDFTVRDAGEDVYAGPVIEISTDDGYLLRLPPSADCIVLNDDDLAPLSRRRASEVRRDDRILVFTHDLHDRLESLLGPVQTTGSPLLESYHKAVRDRVALIPGSKRDQARSIASRIRTIAEKRSESVDLGLHELDNVLRWMSAGRAGDRPDAPRLQKTFGYFMAALGFPEEIAAQYWHNAVVNTRVMAIQAGLHAHGRAQEFVLNPEAFYARYPQEKPELRQLWEEMVRSASSVVDAKLVENDASQEDAQ